MTQISEPQAHELIRRLLPQSAQDQYDADVIACMCPMCQLNLDAYQSQRQFARFNTNVQACPSSTSRQLHGATAFGHADERQTSASASETRAGQAGVGREVEGGSSATEAWRAKRDEQESKPAVGGQEATSDLAELPMPADG
jgi:hypothetical protein